MNFGKFFWEFWVKTCVKNHPGNLTFSFKFFKIKNLQNFYCNHNLWQLNQFLRRPLRQHVGGLYVYTVCTFYQAELKTLQEIASPSFEFAKDLMKHNLVSITLNSSAWYLLVLHLYCIALYWVWLHYITLRCIALRYIPLHWNELNVIALHYIISYCIALG